MWRCPLLLRRAGLETPNHAAQRHCRSSPPPAGALNGTASTPPRSDHGSSFLGFDCSVDACVCEVRSPCRSSIAGCFGRSWVPCVFVRTKCSRCDRRREILPYRRRKPFFLRACLHAWVVGEPCEWFISHYAEIYRPVNYFVSVLRGWFRSVHVVRGRVLRVSCS
jgi:hypothetical protein